MQLLTDRVALITGGGRGIGAAIAVAYAAQGARLVLASRTADELAAVAAQCQALGAVCTAFVADVSDVQAVNALVEHATNRLGTIDILVNAAGVYGPIGLTTDVAIEDWVHTIQVNLLGTLYVARAVLPLMISQGAGRVINLAGGGAAFPLPRLGAYGVSKAAVVRLTETLAEEVRPFGVTVNAIAPGLVDTRLHDSVLQAGEQAGDLYRRVRALREAGTGGTPLAVPAKLAVFLASDASHGLTGRFLSAPHDPWPTWDAAQIAAIDRTAWYTLRRLDPFTVAALPPTPP